VTVLSCPAAALLALLAHGECGPLVYAVQKGDTLDALAAAFGVEASAIAAQNDITDPHAIWAGQFLEIPGAGGGGGCGAAASYTAAGGDTLASVAARLDASPFLLAAMNGLTLADPLEEGTVLEVPAAGDDGPHPYCAGAPTPAGAQEARADTTHTVRPGETLISIAAWYGVPVEKIAQANGIADPGVVEKWRTLAIPGAKRKGPPPAPVPPAAVKKKKAHGKAKKGGTGGGAKTQGDATAPLSAGKWIDIDLATQRLSAYEGASLVMSAPVSTGTGEHPTPAGTYGITAKHEKKSMTGGAGTAEGRYWFPAVPWVMYFHESYALHGAYWHDKFGTQVSHGCVNVPLKAAKWLYTWTPVGTPLRIH